MEEPMSEFTFASDTGQQSSMTSGGTSRGRPAMGVLTEDEEKVGEESPTSIARARGPSSVMVRSSSSSDAARQGRGMRPLPRSRSPGERASGSVQEAMPPVARRSVTQSKSPKPSQGPGFGGAYRVPDGSSMSYGPEEQVRTATRAETARSGAEERRKGSASPSNASLLRRRNIEGAAVKEGYQQTKLATPKPMSIDVDIPELLERPRVVPTTIEGMPTNPSRQLALDQATANLQGDSSVQWAMPTVTAQKPIMFSASLIQEAMPPARGRYVQPAIDQQEAMPPVLGRFGGVEIGQQEAMPPVIGQYDVRAQNVRNQESSFVRHGSPRQGLDPTCLGPPELTDVGNTPMLNRPALDNQSAQAGYRRRHQSCRAYC